VTGHCGCMGVAAQSLQARELRRCVQVWQRQESVCLCVSRMRDCFNCLQHLRLTSTVPPKAFMQMSRWAIDYYQPGRMHVQSCPKRWPWCHMSSLCLGGCTCRPHRVFAQKQLEHVWA
jgi:hypothetical protein